jgi:hypothetical protein
VNDYAKSLEKLSKKTSTETLVYGGVFITSLTVFLQYNSSLLLFITLMFFGFRTAVSVKNDGDIRSYLYGLNKVREVGEYTLFNGTTLSLLDYTPKSDSKPTEHKDQQKLESRIENLKKTIKTLSDDLDELEKDIKNQTL